MLACRSSRASGALLLLDLGLAVDVAKEPTITVGRTRGRVVLALPGVAVFMMRRSYRGPPAQVVHSYGGNFAVSFAV